MKWILNPLSFLSITGNLSCTDFSCAFTFACANDTCGGHYFSNCGVGDATIGPNEKGYSICTTLGPCNMEYFCNTGVEKNYLPG